MVDSVRAASPQTVVTQQTDIGAQTQMRRTRTWLGDFARLADPTYFCFERHAKRIGCRNVTSYEYHLGKYIYTEAPRVVYGKWDAGKIKLVFQKRLDPVSSTNLSNYSLDAGTITAASLDGNIVRLTVIGAPANPVVTVSNISDDESRRYYHDYPACVMTQSQQVTVED